MITTSIVRHGSKRRQRSAAASSLRIAIDRGLLFIVLLGGLSRSLAAADSPDFLRDVRPILSNNCFRCHGFDEASREGKLRLDVREGAVAAREGRPAVVPGKPELSELIRRIEHPDPEERMPPPGSKLLLNPAERETLRKWIANGAEYASHWSLIPPQASRVPPVKHSAWPRNEVDRFVLARLESKGLEPSPEASRETLLRRVSLDLIGLPPTIEELDAFLANEHPQAYEQAVERILASPAFGERMALDWLDAARYADTNGYFGDKTRSVWLYRDWVIGAYNRNLPYDQFTIEQLAGDLLPSTTVEQKIATGFNRNHMANDETGIIDEEYRTEYVADRLETTAATWLGLTVGCARCHDHKYDPLTQREYYQLFAFFNNGVETGLITSDDPPPRIEVPYPEQQENLRRLVEVRGLAERSFAPIEARLQERIADWERTAAAGLPLSPREKSIFDLDFDGSSGGKQVGTTVDLARGVLGQAAKFDATQHIEAESPFDADAAWTVSVWFQADNSLGCILSKIEPEGRRRGLEIIWQKGRLHVHLVNQWGVNALQVVTMETLPGRTWHQLVLRYDGSRKAAGLTLFLNGSRAELKIEQDTLVGSLANSEPLRIARRDSGLGFYGRLDELSILQQTVADTDIKGWFQGVRLRGILAVPAKQRDAVEATFLLDYFLDHHADAADRDAQKQLVAAKKAESELRAAIPTTLVMQELPEQRKTAVLTRGQYDRPAEIVQPGVPAALSPWPVGAPLNRLGLANWLVSPANPLTARVAVNRLWRQCFGEGIVRTINDFGTQGEPPAHPELLDWLAVEFMHSDWDVKGTLKRLVTSATYRQTSSRIRHRVSSPLERLSGDSPDLAAPRAQEDSENHLFARAPSFRWPAEIVRDQALAVSGLLVSRLGGPSVKPYQPPGLWEAVSYNSEATYVADSGDGLWRRSLYTFWKRQSPPPALLTFDGPTREKCTLHRARTNTPLQALVLLNDETYVEAARHLAAMTLQEPGADDFRLRQAFRRVTSRWPDSRELDIVRALLQKQRQRFSVRVADARKLLAIGASPCGQELDPAELAAWTVTLHALLNLDETITRR